MKGKLYISSLPSSLSWVSFGLGLKKMFHNVYHSGRVLTTIQ